MAKKVVARLQTKSKMFTKVIMAVKKEKTGAYSFTEEIIPSDFVQEYIQKKK